MNAVDLGAIRRRFVQELADEEQVVRDRRGRGVERQRKVVEADPEAGTLVIAPGFVFTGGLGPRVAVEVGLPALAAAWEDLVRWGAEALELDSDERNGLGCLRVLLDEAVEGEALDGATDLVLLPSGSFGPR